MASSSDLHHGTEQHRSIVPQMAFKLLNNIENTGGKITDSDLLQLHSLFGPVLTLACELLDNCRITRYASTASDHPPATIRRCVYKIGRHGDYQTVYDHNINYCSCSDFRRQVLLTRTYLTCRHVLALRLNAIARLIAVREETVTDSGNNGLQFVQFLNEQLTDILNEEDMDDIVS